MLGLLIKDLLSLKSYLKSFIIIIALFAFFYISNSQPFFLVMISVMFAMMTVTTFAYDDLAKWNGYAISMPVKRNELVLSKYLLGILLSFIGGLVSLTISMIMSIISNSSLDINSLLVNLGASLLACLFLISLFIPLTFKFGTEKSRLFIMGFALIPTMVVFLLSKLGLDLSVPHFIIEYLPYIIVLAIFIIFFLSILTSIKIFKKIEF